MLKKREPDLPKPKMNNNNQVLLLFHGFSIQYKIYCDYISATQLLNSKVNC